MRSEEELKNLLQKGFILYQKDGKIDTEPAPTFGSLKLHFQDGKFSRLERLEIKK